MAPAVGFIASAAGAMVAGGGLAAAATWTWSGVIGAGLLGAGLSFASQALRKKPSSAQSFSRSITFKDPIAPRERVYGRIKKSGVLAFAHKDGDYLYLIVVLASHEINSIESVWFDDEEVTLDSDGEATGTFAGAATVKKHLGSDSQTADSLFTGAIPDKWTSNHRLRGIAYLALRLKKDEDKFPNGVPNNISAIIKGKELYDTRTTLTAYSANSALVIYDYLTNTRTGLAIAAADIDTTTFNTAANDCEDLMNVTGGGTEQRYNSHGVVFSDEQPDEVLGKLLAACAGTLSFSGGKWKLYVGKYRTPTITINETMLVRPLKSHIKKSGKDRFNRVKGVYISEANNWQAADFPPYLSAASLTADNNIVRWKDNEYLFTLSAAAAQRLAKIDLLDSRQEEMVEVEMNLYGMEIEIGDNIQLTNTHWGITNKVYNVMEWSFNIGLDSAGVPIPTVRLLLKETASTIWDWDAEDTAVDAAPGTSLPSPRTISAPSGVTASSGTDQLLVGSGGDVVSRIKVAWTAITDVYVKDGGWVEVWAKRTSTSNLGGKFSKTFPNEAKFTLRARVHGDEVDAYITDVIDRAAYDIKVRAINFSGVKSAFSSVVSHTVVGKTEPPTSPTYLVAAQNGDKVNFIIDEVEDYDLAGYEIRYSKSTSAQWKNAIPIAFAQKGVNVTSASVPPGTWAFFVRAKDTSGNYSSRTATTTATIRNTASLLSEIIDNTFEDGTLSNFVQHWSGALVPESQMLAQDMTDVQLWDTFVENPYDLCQYETGPVIDIDYDDTVRCWGSSEAVLGPGETEGYLAVTFDLFARASTDSVAAAISTTNALSRSGTFVGCVYHWSDKIVPETTALATDLSDAELWDTFVFTPQATCTYEAPELDVGADRTMYIVTNFTENIFPGDSATYSVDYQLDYKLAAGAYDGFESFASGRINSRYIKQKLVWDTRSGSTFVSAASLTIDAYEPWNTVGNRTGRYFQGRFNMDTTKGVGFITKATFTVDLPDDKVGAKGVATAAGGTTINYSDGAASDGHTRARFHSAPIVTAIPKNAALRTAVVNNVTTTTFDVRVFDQTGAGVSGTIDWEAEGA